MVEKELELKIQKNEYAIVIVFLMIIMITGALLNIMAISFNDGRMPVLYNVENESINTITHFSYTNEQKYLIPRWYITDIIPLDKEHKNIMSIGDLLIFISIPLTLFYIVKIILTNKKIKKVK
ncbi:MAG: DUF5317 family protein [archaeon]